jgi:predicted RNase H-like nuclease (RuvC/YqgF family)
MNQARIVGLSLVMAVAVSGLSASTAVAALPEEVLAQEALAEATEEITEEAEEVAAAPADHLAASRLPSYSRRIGRWQWLVAKVRARKRELRALPLTSPRRIARLPVKRARLREYRQHLRNLRLEIEAKEAAMGLT